MGVFNCDRILLANSKALAEVLVNRSYEFPKPEGGRAFLRRSIGDGLVVAEGVHHKKQRKHSLPCFAFRQIKGLYPLFWEKAVKMTKVIEASAFSGANLVSNLDGKLVGVTDIDYWVPKATLDIIGVAGLGRDFNTLENSHDKIAQLYEALTRPSTDRRNLAALYLLVGERAANLLCPGASRHLSKTTRELRALCEQFVREKRERLKSSGAEAIDTLASLMNAEVFSDQELVDQLLTIIAAG